MEGKERDERTYAIIGAAMEAHNQMGRGFLESIYQEALAVEFEMSGIPFSREVDLPVRYEGRELPCTYRANFICFAVITVELKALPELTGREHSQIINYLRATSLSLGLLLNFGSSKLEHKRFIETPKPC